MDELIRNSLEHGQVFPLKMQIRVRKTKDGAEICYLDNGTGNWRNKKIAVVGRTGRSMAEKKKLGDTDCLSRRKDLKIIDACKNAGVYDLFCCRKWQSRTCLKNFQTAM